MPAPKIFKSTLGDPACSNCLKLPEDGTQHKFCSGCHDVKYCSIECQSKHWKQDHKKHCARLRKLYEAEQMSMKDPIAEQGRYPHIKEFIDAYAETCVSCVELAILGDIISRSRPLSAVSSDCSTNAISDSDLSSYSAFKHIVYLELVPQAPQVDFGPDNMAGNTRTTLGIKRAIYTTYDIFLNPQNAAVFDPRVQRVVALSRQGSLDMWMHSQLEEFRPDAQNLGVMYIMFHTPDLDGRLGMDCYSVYSRLLYADDLMQRRDRLVAEGVELVGLARTWKEDLHAYVRAGLSVKFATTRRDGKRDVSYMKMVKDKGGKTWVDMPLEENRAFVKVLDATRANLPPISPLD